MLTALGPSGPGVLAFPGYLTGTLGRSRVRDVSTSEQEQQLNVWLDRRRYDWLKAKAIADRRTLRATVEMILDEAMRQEDAA